MLFSSSVFLFLFLPLCLLGYQLASRFGRASRFGLLILASVVFYGYWDPRFVFVLAGSMLINFFFMRRIARGGDRTGQAWLVAAITANLGALFYFKYLFPLLGWAHSAGLTSHAWQNVVLPLGISFFTFTQIAYLVDLRQGMAEVQDFLSYGLFVTFFPHLIAGPIIHHREMMPQFNTPNNAAALEEARESYEHPSGPAIQPGRARGPGLNSADMALGLTWFTLGLGKKVLIADAVANLPNEFYAFPHEYGFGVAWLSVLAYAMQLYFDFSGYSDMAMGLARMFSIRFPLNFHSPYKATCIIDFWQRWHMTLTRYLTLYLYNPIALSVNRRRLAAGRKVSKKATRSLSGFVELIAIPIGVTMFLAGVWHGAGMQFLLFGLAHAGYLTVNHAWRVFVPAESRWQRLLPAPVSVGLTFLAVLAAQVFFRANSARDAFYVLGSLVGRHGQFALPRTLEHIFAGFMRDTHTGIAVLAVCLFIVWGMPNTQEILGQVPGDLKVTPSVTHRIRWVANPAWAILCSLLLLRVVASLETSTSFLYFQF
jgi:D-alanyl-lipoteichoic acid acyltransferase DltB (MBOAT superfamily)